MAPAGAGRPSSHGKRARREYEREQERLPKELAHYQTAIAALRGRGDETGAAQADAKQTEIQDALDGINRRAANIRVYVISNMSAFGEDVVKIGMTRRLDPMDRSASWAMPRCRSATTCTPWSSATTPSAWKPTCTTRSPTGGPTWSMPAASSSAPGLPKSAMS
jgi:hypothetical protein